MAVRLLPWVLFLLAAVLRFILPAARPLHHDEGSNFIFLLRLIEEGTWRYDPVNYHGPVLYQIGALPLRLWGTGEATLRLVPALLGSLMAPLVWGLRDRIGRAGAAGAGLLIAISPCFVFYSRFQIHEIYLAFFSLCLALALSRALGAFAPGRTGPRPGACVAAGAAAGAMLATKETALASLGAIGLAGVVWAVGSGARPRVRDLGAALLAALCVTVILYTDFLRNPGALAAIPEGLLAWGGRGLGGEGHDKPWWYFVVLLAREEPWALAGGTLGVIVAAVRREPFPIGLGVWFVLILGAYSAVPYKTPWLVLNPLLPLLLMTGSVVDGVRRSPPAARRALAAALVLVVPWAMARAYDLAIRRPDVEGASGLVYVQTDRDLLRMIDRIEHHAADLPEGLDVPIAILSPDYLPLNWYLRDFRAVAYWGRPVDNLDAPILIVREDQAEAIGNGPARGFDRSVWRLRPGVRLVLFLRPPPADAATEPRTGGALVPADQPD